MVIHDPSSALQREEPFDKDLIPAENPYSDAEMDGYLDIKYDLKIGGKIFQGNAFDVEPLLSSDPNNGISMGSANDDPNQVGVSSSGRGAQLVQLIPIYPSQDEDN